MANKIIAGDYFPARILWRDNKLCLWRFPMEWMTLDASTVAWVDQLEPAKQAEGGLSAGGFVGGFIGFIPIFIPLGLFGGGDSHGVICEIRFRDGSRSQAELDESHWRALQQAVLQ